MVSIVETGSPYQRANERGYIVLVIAQLYYSQVWQKKTPIIVFGPNIKREHVTQSVIKLLC